MKNSNNLLALWLGIGLFLAGFTASFAAEEEKASKPLFREHEATLLVIGAAEDEASAMRKTGHVDAKKIRNMVQFFRNFTDECHHAKEERFYFPAAQIHSQNGISQIVRELKTEHQQGRAILDEVEYLLTDSVSGSQLAERLDAYAALMRTHIEKEDDLLFPKANAVLPASEHSALLAGFRKVEEIELGKGFHEKYHALAMELAGKK